MAYSSGKTGITAFLLHIVPEPETEPDLQLRTAKYDKNIDKLAAANISRPTRGKTRARSPPYTELLARGCSMPRWGGSTGAVRAIIDLLRGNLGNSRPAAGLVPGGPQPCSCTNNTWQCKNSMRRSANSFRINVIFAGVPNTGIIGNPGFCRERRRLSSPVPVTRSSRIKLKMEVKVNKTPKDPLFKPLGTVPIAAWEEG
ncbi:hypothetical protein BD779DRAFT_1474370 [Infundibulicybe gibba]|nr:hypothetical protein BD779DRAFT_1474370 [Infundibulicybe gibba]